MMSKFMMAALSCVLAAGAALAQHDKGVPPTNKGTNGQQKQQERPNACAARANDQGLTGTARNDFMAACLKGDAAVGAQQKGKGK